ncbi:MAG: AMP-binding protein, partial [Oscillospiraceae bacterium]|jgi:D-alanine--poly(phosphoribitol) ligase subunit 1|nr:AMP-binding protein [Oscillospiraceae bacterium]
VYQSIAAFSATGRTAINYGGEALTYSDVAERARRLAAYISGACGADKSPVIIYGHKDIDIIPCMLGVSLSGRAYAPIDTSFPEARLDAIIGQLRPKLVIDFAGKPAGGDYDMLSSAELRRVLTSGHAPNGNLAPPDDDICYILFTSGSTGAPKGVEIRHRNLKAFLEYFNPLFFIGDGSHTVLDAFSYSFDLSVGYIYPALYNGYALHAVDRRTIENIPALFEDLANSGAEIIVSTPSFIEMCLNSARFDRSVLPLASRFIFCGETLRGSCALKLMERFPGAKVINTYGPTEATVLVTGVEITAEMAESGRPLPIGRPLGDTLLRAVDEDGRAVPDGAEGELQIIGRSVGAGYFNRPELTALSFFEDAGTGLPGYATGDIGYSADGLFYYCRRGDSQVKLNGYRIELGDVENNLLRLPYVSSASVLPIYDGGRVARLAAFVVPRAGAPVSERELRLAIKRDLAELMPGYMIPGTVTALDMLPINKNGKLDRRALSELLPGPP